jgi:hypothetical protein
MLTTLTMRAAIARTRVIVPSTLFALKTTTRALVTLQTEHVFVRPFLALEASVRICDWQAFVRHSLTNQTATIFEKCLLFKNRSQQGKGM